MRISRKTDYALVILAELVGFRSKESCYVPISRLSWRVGLSVVMTQKLVSELAAIKLIETRRGKLGGVRLSKLPESINLAEVVAVFEGPLEVTVCSRSDQETCRLKNSCSLYGRWQQVNAAITQALSGISLSDLMSGAQLR